MSQIERRKLKNLVVDLRFLTRSAAPFMILLTGSLVVIGIMDYVVVHSLRSENLPLAFSAFIVQLVSHVTLAGILGSFFLGVLCFVLWTVYSHRVIGPTVPIRRHLKELAEGNYSARIKIREKDEFKEIAEDLNHLAEVLESKRDSA